MNWQALPQNGGGQSVIQYQKYEFHCRWTSPALLHAYWGSAIRGGLGRWLRKACCVLRASRCSGCAVRQGCGYSLIFETERLDSNRAKVNARPHPVILEPPFPAPASTGKGDCFSFSMILIDRANEFLPHIIYSITRMGKEDGMGAKANQGHGRFALASVTCNSEVLYDEGAGELRRPSGMHTLSLRQGEEGPASRIEVRFETPFRAKHKGRFSNSVPFHLLVRAALRRISSLEAAYGPGEPELDYPGLVSSAEEVKTVHEELAWQELPRYSTRQHRKMTIGGPVGTVTYQGNMGRFLPLLEYCETVHLGKQTFFGLGKIRVQVNGRQAT